MRVFVTGASRGIGLELVRQYASAGNTVIATCRSVESASDLDEVAATHSLVQVEDLDVSSQSSIECLARRIAGQPVDVLYNNAGYYGRHTGRLDDTDVEDWIEMFRVNTMAPLQVTRALLPTLRQAGTAKVIMLSSIKASISCNTLGGSYQYRATKSALNAIVKSLAIDLRDEGIGVYALSPGWVVRDEKFGADLDYSDRLRKARKLVAEFGPNGARQTLQEAVSRMIVTVTGLALGDSGAFLDHVGQPLPW